MTIKKSQLKQWLIPFLKLLIASCLILWLVRSGRFDLESLSHYQSPWIWLSGISLFLVLIGINSWRWKLLLGLESVEISLPRAYQLSLVGIFFNFFMPGGVGGDVVKAAYLMRDYQAKKWFIGWSILVDRILGMLALFLYSGITGVLFYKKLPATLQMSVYSLSLMILFGLVSLVGILIFSPKKNIEKLLKSQPLLEKSLLPLFYFFQRPSKIVVPFLLSLVGQGLVMGIAALLVFSAGVSLSLWMILLIFPFGFLATILPISPAGIGVGQAAFFFLFDKVAGQGEFGVLIITFIQAIQFLVGLLGGLFFVLYKKETTTAN
ncbi:MAG: lysylphosphatidylglycerol synthase transmembrane domain-containing protein [Pseudomonadota bacterium]